MYCTDRETLSRKCNSNYVNSSSVRGVWYCMNCAYTVMSPKLAVFTWEEFLSWACDSVVVRKAQNVGDNKEGKKGEKRYQFTLQQQAQNRSLRAVFLISKTLMSRTCYFSLLFFFRNSIMVLAVFYGQCLYQLNYWITIVPFRNLIQSTDLVFQPVCICFIRCIFNKNILICN